MTFLLPFIALAAAALSLAPRLEARLASGDLSEETAMTAFLTLTLAALLTTLATA